MVCDFPPLGRFHFFHLQPHVAPSPPTEAPYKDMALCLLFVVHVPDRWSSGQTAGPSGGKSSPFFL